MDEEKKNEERKVLTYDTGIDENEDKHCDRCGWFVNDYDRHKARPVMLSESETLDPKWLDRDLHLERISAAEFADEFIKRNPYSKADYDKTMFADVLRYSRNRDDELSCKVIQMYLRNEVVTPGHSEREICMMITRMQLGICRFKINKTITLYRGESGKPDSFRVKQLDAIYETWKATGKPVKVEEKGFLSLTRSVETMNIYADSESNGKCHIYIAATVDEGIYALPLSEKMGTAANGIDKEVLLPCGTEYYIIDMKRIPNGDGTHDYRMHIVITDRRLEK